MEEKLGDFGGRVYLSVETAVTSTTHWEAQTVEINLLTVLEARKSKIKMLTSCVPGESALLGLQVAAFLLCPHTAFLRVCGERSLSSIYKATNPMRLGPLPYDLM